ncbi:MAG: M15 family metallopeptidase [Rickettsiaceae bacterium]|nr:M15 family metallopeptidase [Rickettsiaceae bacterium]
MLLFTMQNAFSNELHKDFVYLSDIDSTILQSARYFSSENFVGKRLIGYNKATIILTKQTADRLKQIQNEVKKDGYALVVYDAYRPQKTVDAFIAWSKDIKSLGKKDEYYPYVNKEKIFKEGYLITKSGHSRGSTVDLTLIKIDKKVCEIVKSTRVLTDGRKVTFLDDGTIDMGTSFDLFDKASHHDTNLVSAEAVSLRNYLREKMLKFGFKELKEEWWHYTLKDEPFPNQYFDFNIE